MLAANQIAAFCSYALYCRRYHLGVKRDDGRWEGPFWGGWSRESLRPERVRRFVGLCSPMAVGIALENWSISAMPLLSGRFADRRR